MAVFEAGQVVNPFPDANALFPAMQGQWLNNQAQQIQNQYAPQRNQLLIDQGQQQVGMNEQEMIARAANAVTSNPDRTTWAAGYAQQVANLQRLGLAMRAPAQYPGDAAMLGFAQMGTPSEKLSEYAANRAFNPLGTPPQPTASATPPSGPGYAPTGAPLTPFIATNLPAGVSTAEDQAVRTVIGEAAGEPTIGQAGVAHVIANRVKQSGGDVQSVVFAPNQFEPWNNPATRAKLEAIDPNSAQYQQILNNVVRPALAGQTQDPTGGATHFYSPTAQAQLQRAPPSWATGTPTVIGRHNFYNIGYKAAPGGGTTTTATAGTTGGQPVVLGDSLASPGGLGGSGVIGAKPAEVLDQVKQQAQSGRLRGQDVVISSGASNDPSATALVEQQIQAAKDGGAKSVTVVGVGNRPDIVGANPVIQRIAEQNGARFVPVDPATLSGDQVHPANYAPLRQAVRLGGTATAGPGAGPSPGPTAPPAAPPAPAAAGVMSQGELPGASPPNMIAPGAPNGQTLPPPAPAPQQQAQAAPPPPQQQPIVGPQPPALLPLNANGITAQQQQMVDAARQTGRITPQQQIQQIDSFRQQNLALQQKAFSDYIQAQQLAVSQGQLSVSQANSNLERYKADPAYQGMVKRAQETNSNIEVRGVGNFIINPDGSRTLVPQPYQTDAVGPGGAKMPGFSYPGFAGGPSTFSPTVGPGGQPITSTLSPEAEAESKAYGAESQSIIETAAKAPVSLQRLDVLENAATAFRPGSSAAMRLAGAKVMTDALQGLGISPPAWLANGAAAGETIGKEGGFLASEMTRVLGSREAASVFSQIKSFQPNIEMSQGGFQVIINSERQGLQRDQDIANFREQWLADPTHNGSIRGMLAAFEKVAPIEAYASRIVPYPMPKTQEAAIPNVIYNTSQGPARWNGTAFEPIAQSPQAAPR